MLKGLALLVAVGTMSGAAYAQWNSEDRAVRGSGVARTETRNVGRFNAIDIGAVWKVDVRVGPKTSVKIEIDDNLMQYVQNEVKKGELNVYFSRSINNVKSMKIWITTPELDKLSIGGASNAEVTGVATDRFSLECSGASALTLKGRVESLLLDASGATRVDLTDLDSRSASVGASGAASVRMSVRDRLTFDVSGASSVRFRGNPRVQGDVSGVGSVRRM